jgi:hypothetical protein
MDGVRRYAVIETALCIGGNIHDGEILMVRADEHDRELAALRKELIQWKSLVDAIGATIPLAQTLAGTATQQSMVQYFKGLHAERDNLQKYLTAAEQQHGEFVEVVRKMYLDDGFTNEACAEIEVALGMTKPTDSGASE